MRALALAALVLLAGCAAPGVGPAPEPDGPPVRLSVEAARTAAGVRAVAELTHAGSVPVHHRGGCGEEAAGVAFVVVDAEGRPLRFRGPSAEPRCAATPGTLLPGAERKATATFEGLVWSEEGEPSAAPAGRYAFVATFAWWGAASDPAAPIVLEARAPFDWPGGARVPDGPRVRLVLSNATASPDAPVEIEATAVNAGEGSVWYEAACTGGVSISLWSGQRFLRLGPSTRVCRQGDADRVELPPGGNLTARLVWNATEWDEASGRWSRVPPGTYAVRAEFFAWDAPAGGRGAPAVNTRPLDVR